VGVLLRCRAAPDVTTRPCQRTALHLSAQSGHTEAARALLRGGASNALADSNGKLALHGLQQQQQQQQQPTAAAAVAGGEGVVSAPFPFVCVRCFGRDSPIYHACSCQEIMSAAAAACSWAQEEVLDLLTPVTELRRRLEGARALWHGAADDAPARLGVAKAQFMEALEALMRKRQLAASGVSAPTPPQRPFTQRLFTQRLSPNAISAQASTEPAVEVAELGELMAEAEELQAALSAAEPLRDEAATIFAAAEAQVRRYHQRHPGVWWL
jgi:hypothetical protein